jgi:hypothetical protein
MNAVWRFYMDPERRWRWQQLTASRELVLESRAAYKEYDDCMNDARTHGYVHQPSLPRMRSK